MKKDYIAIAGQEYRVEVNWNALAAFLKEVGRDTIEELAAFSTIRPSEIAPLMWACLAEGERLEGREFNLSILNLGALITPRHVADFMDIYVRQSSPQMEVEEPKKEAREESPAR
jgi:hypothetical protein